MSEHEAGDLIPIREAARLLAVSRFTLYYWAQARKVPHYRVGRRVLFSRTELLAWLAEHRVDAA